MRRRSRAWWAVAAGVLVVAGCREAREGGVGAAARDPARERVLAFWRTFRAATSARIEHDCGKAAPLYEAALALDPRHEDTLYYLGQCRRELGFAGAARSAFERLVAQNPSSARGHLALGALLASPDPREPMDLAAAELHLRRAHEINGEETGPMVRLGEVLLVRGQRAEARSWFESALRTNPKSVEAALLVGYLARPGRGSSVERVRAAAKAETPVRGVLGEGDRRAPASGDAAHTRAAPPLERPLGRLLLAAPAEALRARAADGKALSAADLARAWAQIDELVRVLGARAGTGEGGRAAARVRLER